jgi:hypothetical protein
VLVGTCSFLGCSDVRTLLFVSRLLSGSSLAALSALQGSYSFYKDYFDETLTCVVRALDPGRWSLRSDLLCHSAHCCSSAPAPTGFGRLKTDRLSLCSAETNQRRMRTDELGF